MDKKIVNARGELEGVAGVGADQDHRLLRMAEALKGEYMKHVSPQGAIPGLSELLDKRRCEYMIPDEMFEIEASFDRVFVFQLPRVFGDKIEGSVLYKPDSARKREEESTPRGVIVSAGLKALDNLRSNGMDLGHIVNFLRLAPWKLPVLEVSGIEFSMLILRDGDIIGSEDLVSLRRAGKVKTTSVAGQHQLEYADGSSQPPQMPWIADDY